MAEHIVVSVENRVLHFGWIVWRRKNALTRGMYLGMIEALKQADADPNIRVVLITGSEACFTAGNDLVDFANAKPGETSPAILYLQTLAARAEAGDCGGGRRSGRNRHNHVVALRSCLRRLRRALSASFRQSGPLS